MSGWREAGIDMLAELGAREGGLSANLLRDEHTEVLSVTDLSGKASPDVAGYTRLALRPAPPGGVDERLFMSFPRHLAGGGSHRRMRGTAMCYGRPRGLTLHTL